MCSLNKAIWEQLWVQIGRHECGEREQVGNFFNFLNFDLSIVLQKNPSVRSINIDSTWIFILLYTNYSTKFNFMMTGDFE